MTETTGDEPEGSPVERVALLQEWPPVRGLTVAVIETAAHPRSIVVQIIGGPFGFHEAAMIDSTEVGARARAISLGELLHDALEGIEMAWFDDWSSD